MEMYQIRLIFRSQNSHIIQQNYSLFKYSKAGIINLKSDAKKYALHKVPTEIIKSTHKSRFQVITINNINENEIGAINMAYEYLPHYSLKT